MHDETTSRESTALESPTPPPFEGELVCSGCGIENPSHMRFCKQCGTRLLVIDAQGAFHSVPSNQTEASEARLVCVENNGVDGKTFALEKPQTDIGRKDGDIIFSDDPYLSPRHARIVVDDQGARVIDLASANGVFLRITEPVRLEDGDVVLLGQQVLRFERTSSQQSFGSAYRHGVKIFGTPEVGRAAWLIQLTTEGLSRDAYCLYREETILGRESGDIVFTDDPFLSRRHAAISHDRAKDSFYLVDLGSSNGTGLRIRGENRLISGDQLRIGRQLLRFEHAGAFFGEEGYD